MGARVYFSLINVHKYNNELVPAYRAIMERSDRAPIKSILKGANVVAGIPQQNRPGFVDLSPAEYEEYSSILDGEQFYSQNGDAPKHIRQNSSEEDIRFFVKNQLAPTLLALVCVESEANLNPWQELSGPEFTEYLYANSRWIEDRLTFAKEFQGDTSEIVLGEWSLFLGDEEVGLMNGELSRIPPPQPAGIKSDYLNLRAICQKALDNEKSKILACIV